MQEGTFFGDIIDTGPLSGKTGVTAPVAYYCDGAGFPAGSYGVVAGRLGANQVNSPYSNPFGAGVLCQTPVTYSAPVNVPFYTGGIGGSCPAGSIANPAGGCPDGYQEMQYPYGSTSVPWNHAITVWRNANYTPVFDTSYQYQLSAVLTNGNPMVVDVGSSPIQQWNKSAGLGTSVFNMTPSGSNWTISPITMSGKCLDAGGATNSTAVVVNACNGAASQSWKITAISQNGAFNVATAATGRCLNVRGGNGSAGTVMEVYDCTAGWTSEQFNIQATVYAGDTSNQTTSTGGSTGTGGSTSTGGSTGTGGSTSTGGSTGTGGSAGSTGTVAFSDNFEAQTSGTNTPANWTRVGGSSGDWSIQTDGSKVLTQNGSTSSTLRMQTAGPVLSGATSIAAQVKLVGAGSSNPAAMVCLRYSSTSNYYCAALGTTGVQIKTMVNGTAGTSSVFAATVATGTWYSLKLSVDASGVLSATLGTTVVGTYTPTALASGNAAVATASMTASFDSVVYAQP